VVKIHRTMHASAQTLSTPVGVATGPAAPRWRLRLMGAFELHNAQHQLARLPTRAASLLLAELALGAGQDHPRETLIERLWPGVAAQPGRNRLRQALSVLRGVLEPGPADQNQVLLADRHNLRLAPGALWCDAVALRVALAAGDTRTVLALDRGELLPGAYEDWVLEARQQLADRIAQMVQPGVAPTAVVAPTRNTAAPGTTASLTSGLPLYLTRMWGFELAAEELAQTVQRQRLVVLRGPGGAGKTRLAVEVARALAANAAAELSDEPNPPERFDLICFVALAACSTRAQMHDALLLALQRDADAFGADAAWRIASALTGRRVLLLLDNFEQLVEAGRSDVLAWLAQAPGLHVLVTSRRVLGVDGETEHAIAPMPAVPPDGSLQDHALHPGVALFVARARAVRADFVLSLSNHQTVAEIVQSLGGLPLAIELAAARLRSLPLLDVHQMLHQRDAPGQALKLLARGGPRGADDPRHASMLQVVQWSWQLLSGPQQQALIALAHCDGGVDLGGAAQLLGMGRVQAASLLDAFVAASVVATQPSAHDENIWRYLPFQPVREYALMVAGEGGRAQARAAHRAWVGAWAKACAAGLNAAPALGAFRDELPNLLAAMATALADGVPEQAVALALTCDVAFADVNLPASGVSTLLEALARSPQGVNPLAHVLVAELAFKAGLRDAVMPNVEKALAVAGPAHAQRVAVSSRAAMLLLRVPNDMARAQLLFNESLALARAQHDVSSELLALKGLAILAVRRDHDMQRNLALHQQSLVLAQQHCASPRQAEVMITLAIALGYVHRPLDQLPLLEQTRRVCETTGQRRLWAFSCSVTGYVLADLRRFDEAAASYRACLQRAWEDKAWREWFYPLWNLPRTLAHQRRPEAAAQMMGFAEQFYAQRFGAQGWEDTREARRTRRLVAVQIGAAATTAAWASGRALSMVQAMQLALRETEVSAATPVAGNGGLTG
jgi:predicted ATPase